LVDGEYGVTDNTIIVKTSERVLLDYFWRQLEAQRLNTMVFGSGQPLITGTLIKGLELPLPSTKAEQEAIAEALSDADAYIESLEQLIAKKRLIKQGAMQELLTGKRRLPGFEKKKGTKQTDVGVIPEDWSAPTMGEIGEPLIGLTYTPGDVSSYGTLVLRSSNVQDGRLAFDDNVFVQMDVPDRATTRAGDILVCVRNGSRRLIGKCALIDDRTAGAAFGAFMSVFRSDMNRFVFFQFQSSTVQRQIGEVLGATINQITNRDMRAFRIPVPPTLAEREAIADVLSDIGSEIIALDTKLAKAGQIKQGMMHNLLTGRIRLV
jgi:type I restriction enzyme S subunit